MRSNRLLPLLVLAACTPSHRPVASTAPPSRAPSADARVKVGQPYQVLGQWYYPSDDRSYDTTGIASWYGPGFHGLQTANGEPYDQDGLTAAHKTLPLPSFVEVTNLDNGRVLTVRVNDRGPFVAGRVIDLSRRSAQLLGVDGPGTAHVRVRRVYPEGQVLAALAPPPRAMPEPPPRAVPEPSPKPVAVTEPPMPVTTVAIPGAVPARAIAPAVTLPAGTVFVQVAALSDEGRASWLSGFLKPFGAPLTERSASGLWRVRLGPYASRADAMPVLAQVQAAGYTAAQIVVAPRASN